jgi:uncharacterized membrane protein
MNNRLGFIKTTVVGGFVFLIPAVIVVIVLGKVIGTLKVIATTLSPFFGIESLVGGLFLDLIAFVAIVLLCFVAGFIAKHAFAKRIREKLDTVLLNSFPGYAIIKGFAENLRQTEQLAGTFLPVLVRFDDYVQIALETHRDSAGKVAVYLPGAPNPWSGTVVYVSQERVEPLAMTLTEAVRNIRNLGKGSLEIADKEQNVGNTRCA